MANGLKRLREQWYTRQLVRSIASQLDRHEATCQICSLVHECEQHKALRWLKCQYMKKVG